VSLSAHDRQKMLQKMQNQTFDLVIIGGGISGAGVARDAASRGMRVALVEAQDFAAGTSSRSSKLIHGGIRYLENLEFGLVFEALQERTLLFDMAPHLVHPLRFMLPLYKGGRLGMFKLGLGMWLYDALSMFEAPELHERLSAAATHERAPLLHEQGLAGSYVYSDAYMDDDRLVLETLRSAGNHGAVQANYVRAIGAEWQRDKVSQLVVEDVLAQKKFKISGKHFVSTVGPWTDHLATSLLNDWRKIMRPTKGVHITFERSRVPLNEAVVMISDDEKRIVFAIPRHEMVIVGTTDTDFKGDPQDVRTEQEDIDYLLKVSAQYFPGAQLTEADIVASYSGVRPLVHDGSDSESKTSREHLIYSDPRNITFLTGGKYTTYRHMAESTMQVVLQNFALEDQVRWSNSQTMTPLNPLASPERWRRAKAEARQRSVELGLDVDAANMLADRHGEEAWEIAQKFGKRAATAGAHAPIVLEALHAIHNTMCMNLLDFYLRRVPLFLAQKDHGAQVLPLLAEVFAEELGWSLPEKQEAINAISRHLSQEMGWRKS
jgi:glycerol-3-phosphate dehydrogenase